MVRKPLLQTLFDAFSILRWNDQIRPMELVEMDKHAHKMAIVYCLAKYEEDKGAAVNWTSLVKGGVFELLRRSVLTDIKAPVYRKIHTQHPDVARRLGEWVYSQLESKIDDGDFKDELRAYLRGDDILDPGSKQILAAAHVFASHWEFQLIKAVSPFGVRLAELDVSVQRDLEEHLSLTGMQKLVSAQPVLKFVDLVGQLRFQKRWAQTPRIPETSVLGHSLLVAVIVYLFSLEISACERRIRNNFFSALFHDLPEALSRDIISPVKRAVEELTDVIGEIERELVDQEIIESLEEAWRDDFRYLIEDEFESRIVDDGEVRFVTSEEINERYNEDRYNPVDGQLVRAADHLAAYLEAYQALKTGISTKPLQDGKAELWATYRNRTIGGIAIGRIYEDFES